MVVNICSIKKKKIKRLSPPGSITASPVLQSPDSLRFYYFSKFQNPLFFFLFFYFIIFPLPGPKKTIFAFKLKKTPVLNKEKASGSI